MLAISYDLPTNLRDELGNFAHFKDIFPMIADYFVELVQEQIDRGLYQAYIEEADNLTAIRGRIDFTADIRENVIVRNRIACRFSELTWDIPENQIIRQVIHMLRHFDFPIALRARLHIVDNILSSVSHTKYSIHIFDRFRYHRNNSSYQPIHQLCRLFLDGASLIETSGNFAFYTFLIDMNRLFESFIIGILQKHFTPALTITSQQTSRLDRSGMINVRPDCRISWQGHLLAVIDCKYKRDIVPSPSDCYQLLAYCTALQCVHGILIYPFSLGFRDHIMPITNSPITIITKAIDLNSNGNAFSASWRTFAEGIRATFP